MGELERARNEIEQKIQRAKDDNMSERDNILYIRAGNGNPDNYNGEFVEKLRTMFDEKVDKYMSEMIKTCDFYTGENTDNIHYDDCIECYRYITCKNYTKNKIMEKINEWNRQKGFL